jgi:hypothetical protein
MNSVRVWRYLISFLVIVSLALNAFLINMLVSVQDRVRSARDSAQDALVALGSDPITIPIAVDQDIPVITTVAFSDTVVIPFELDYRLSTVVNTSINIPLLGRQSIAVPVDAVIPVSETFEIPIQVDVPVSMTYPMQAELLVEVEVPTEITEELIAYLEGLSLELPLPLR